MVENSARLDEPETAGPVAKRMRILMRPDLAARAILRNGIDAPRIRFWRSTDAAALHLAHPGGLRRVPGVHGVLCIDEESGQPLHVQHFARGEAEARKTAGVLSDACSRAVARALLDDDDQLLTVSIRTRLQLEYVLRQMLARSSRSPSFRTTAQAPNGRDEAHVVNLARSMMESSHLASGCLARQTNEPVAAGTLARAGDECGGPTPEMRQAIAPIRS